MLGVNNRQGRYTVKFRLSQISLAYLRVRDDPALSAKARAPVEAWLKELALKVCVWVCARVYTGWYTSVGLKELALKV
jgi:hypothetical protein